MRGARPSVEGCPQAAPREAVLSPSLSCPPTSVGDTESQHCSSSVSQDGFCAHGPAVPADSVLARDQPSFLPLPVSTGPGVPLLVWLAPGALRCPCPSVLSPYVHRGPKHPASSQQSKRCRNPCLSTGDVQGSRAAKVLAFLRSAWIGHSDQPLDFLCLRPPRSQLLQLQPVRRRIKHLDFKSCPST